MLAYKQTRHAARINLTPRMREGFKQHFVDARIPKGLHTEAESDISVSASIATYSASRIVKHYSRISARCCYVHSRGVM